MKSYLSINREVILPNYEESIVNLPNWILDYFKTGKSKIMEGKEKIILLIVDSLGLSLLEKYVKVNKDSPLSKLYVKGNYILLHSTFPSTTTTALTSLNTGLKPLEHAILGYTMFLKEFGAIVNMINFSPALDNRRETLLEAGLDLNSFLNSLTFFEKLNQEGIKGYVITRNFLKNTALSKILHKGAEVLSYVNLSDLFVTIKNHMRNCKSPSYTFAYWDALDTLSHIYGPDSEQVFAELDVLSFCLEKILNELDKDTLLMISGDHGSLKAEEIVKYDEQKELKEKLRLPPAGDSRAFFLFPKPNKVDDVKNYFEDKLKDKFLCMRIEEALDLKLFGSGNMHDSFYDRVGELLCLAKKNYVFQFRLKRVQEEVTLKGFHGGLSYDEIFVPLIFTR